MSNANMPAFPIDGLVMPVQINGTVFNAVGPTGLTKREYFAGIAFGALITKIPLHDQKGTLGIKEENTHALYVEVARSARLYAEVMVEELSKENT